MEGIESIAVFEEKVAMTPRDLANPKINIASLLLAKLSEKMQAKCSLHGWVVPGSLKILSRSMGYLEKGRFTGDVVFHVQAQASVLNPASGSHLVAEVTGNNKMGMYVTYKVNKKEEDRKTKQIVNTEVDAIKIILPRDLHIGDEAFSKVEIGDKVHVEIKKSRFQVNDNFILSVGVFEGKVNSGYVAPQVEEQEETVIEEKGPGEQAKERVQQFEKEVTAEPTLVLENDDMPDLVPIAQPQVSNEPLLFNAAKINVYKEFDNRFPSPFTLDGKAWPTVEHYYQAMKFPELPEFQEQIRAAPTATAAAKLGKTKDPLKPIRLDWKDQREAIMKKAVTAKFDQNPGLKQMLLDTYPRPLIFDDTNDAFWGVGRTRMGQNKLGNILLDYRNTRTGMEAVDG